MNKRKVCRKQTSKKEKLFSMLLAMVFVLSVWNASILSQAASKDSKVKPVSLNNETTITKYDVTGDGVVDEVKIECDEPNQSFEGMGNGWKVYINGEVAYCQKSDNIDYVTVKLFNVSTKRVYLDIEENLMDSGIIYAHGLYQYKDNKLKCVCNFYDYLKKCINDEGYNLEIKSMTSKKIVVTYRNQFYATGYLKWEVSYKYKSGKWKRTSNTYTVKEGINQTAYNKKYWTANKKFTVTKKVGGSAKAFTVKKGSKVKIKKICIKNKNTYMQITNSKGKKGWLKNPKTHQKKNYFVETMFAG